METPKPTIKALLQSALPLIAAGLASNLTIFADRIILSDYSNEMMSHVTTISNYCWIFLFTVTGITYISKVFVGQYNGSRQYHLASAVTWQMIILSAFSLLIFMPAYHYAPYFLPSIAQEHGLQYFRILMLSGVMWPISSALASFFIGTQQNTVVFITLIASNLINIKLDLEWIPIWGTSGAAWATAVSMFFQIIILFSFFLSPKNNTKYHTHHITVKPKMMYKALVTGYPEAVMHFFEMAAWAAVITIISSEGPEYMLVSNLAQNIFILFMFVYTEVGNAVKSFASNYIGENRAKHIPQLMRSAFILHSLFIMVIALTFTIFPELFVTLFSLESQPQSTIYYAVTSLKGIFMFLFLDGVAYILSSVLIAHGDTFNSMVITGVNMWAFLVTPTYILIHYLPHSAATHSLVILPFYGICITMCYGLRYLYGKIHKINLAEL